MNAAGLFVSMLFDDAFFCAAAATILFVLPAIVLTKKIRNSSIKDFSSSVCSKIAAV